MKKFVFVGVMTMLALPFFGASAQNNGNFSSQTKSHTRRVVINNAVVTGTPTATILNATKGSTTYTVDITNAKLVRKYNAKAAVSEIMAGDFVTILGTIPGADPTQITATKVQDTSIQKLDASFQGTITAIDSANSKFTLQSLHRGVQTVNVLSTTAIKYQKQTKAFSDLAGGDTVIVKGIWNSTHSIIYGTTNIKITKLAT